jgi:hypothetical protein
MDPQITAQLTALGVVVIGALGTLVTLLIERVKRDLAANTQITQEAKEAANGRLSEALAHLAAERDRTFALRTLLRERDDRFEYVRARLPDVDRVLQGYEEKRQQRYTAAEEHAALQRILEAPIGD